ncbi:MAG TPA: TonB-dependent receptor [Thermoanaerobaculia bacterium]|nr:TonB-dependent receptor [Thermoanaerobaculia bacterium]
MRRHTGRPRVITAALIASWLLLPALLRAVEDPPSDAAKPASEEASEPAKQPHRESIEVESRADELVGIADSATEGVVGRLDLAQRPLLRPAEVLETVPGVLVTQHSGGGKANQYFLRGFNLDHGTDFRLTVGGIPVNLPTHAHGHGYSDLSFLIPEMVSAVDYRKGPYAAEDGDFASAGSARIELVRSLPAGGIVEASGGSFDYGRLLAADSWQAGGGDLLAAVELAGDDGPWQRGDDLRRGNALLRWSRGDVVDGASVTAMAYDGSWHATDQIPAGAVAAGEIDRFGAVDPSDGGSSSRYSVAAELRRSPSSDTFDRASAYVLDYHLDLFSNFTYFLDDLDNGDQFEQRDDRTALGIAASRQRFLTVGGRDTAATVGIDARADRIDNGLYHTRQRARLATTRQDDVTQALGGAWAEARTTWTPWLRTIAALRFDGYWTDVDSNLAVNSGRSNATMLSPKLSVALGPWKKSELYLNAGYGFHSNDARGTTIRVDPTTGEATGRVDPLVRATAVDLGVRTSAVHGLQSTASLYLLDLDSELLFVGDAGITEATRPSRRVGIELANFWQPSEHVRVDVDAAWARARFRDEALEGDRIPGAIEGVLSAGVAFENVRRWSGGLRLRYFGPRPLVEDDSVRSASSTLAYVQVGYDVTPRLTLRLEAFNLLDAEVSDIDYFYTSRLRSDREATDDVHFHPAEPRSLRVVVTRRF